MKITILPWFILLVAAAFSSCQLGGDGSPYSFSSDWGRLPDRQWVGPRFWANRLQDWRLHGGRLECTEPGLPLRTLHLLTGTLSERSGGLEMEVVLGALDTLNASAGMAGFLIGAGDLSTDYRARAQVHHTSGRNGGLAAGIDGEGRLVFLDNENSLERLPGREELTGRADLLADGGVRLRLELLPQGETCGLILEAYGGNGKRIARSRLDSLPASRFNGNLALVAHRARYWFQDWKAGGEKLRLEDEHGWGPVLGVLFTVSRGVLKLTAQLPPLGPGDSREAGLEIRAEGDETWREVASGQLIEPGWTVPFRVDNWDTAQEHAYRVVYDQVLRDGSRERTYYYGIVPREPAGEELVVAAFTGNYNGSGIHNWKPEPDPYDFSNNQIWFPHRELIDNVQKHRPDLLVYTGDQLYEGSLVTPDRSGGPSSYLDYFNKWYLFLWAHGELTRRLPAVCITDDHDIYQINYWGDGGKKARDFPVGETWEEVAAQLPAMYRNATQHYQHDGGGYIMPAEWVNMVQRTQCSHLPDPFDPRLVEQGIEVYYTDLLYGGISFAIIEDRKFKSAPQPLLPEADILNGFPQTPGYDLRRADHPAAVLLGERQLDFLDHWAADWRGSWMKVVLSATIFSCVNSEPVDTKGVQLARLPALPPGVIPDNYAPSRDMDTNGWPQSGRRRALTAIRRGSGFMIAGDQHLGSIVQHGIDDWDDAGFSFCVPAIANIAPRRWFTQQPGLNRREDMPPYLGNHFDAFGNRMYVWAVSNPYLTGREPAQLYDRATGYGIIRLNKRSQAITMECWPRWADPADPAAGQYPGWPKTITVQDNDGRKPRAWLPVIATTGLERPPVVQVRQAASGELLYTVRAMSTVFRAKVFQMGNYDVGVGEPGTAQWKELPGIRAGGENLRDTLKVAF